ncbi:MAG TPA: YcgN family cysteine cluster protein [Desulfobacterales bacterium]|nr:YcgN family cysteine cluster protein [Desulfobacterales bacterium]
MLKSELPFWKTKALHEMTVDEWESLCDGCGRCCLQKLENKKTGKVYYTSVACYLLNNETCRCKSYKERTRLVTECLILKPETAIRFRWLPVTCAYRLLAEGKELAWWHPLLSGDPDTVHQAGISVRGKVISEEYVHPDDLENYILNLRTPF